MTTKAKTGKETAGAAETYEKVVFAGKESVAAAAKGYDKLVAFNKENFEAVLAAGNAAAKGVEEINAEVIAYGKEAIEDNIAAAKALLTAKTLRDAVDLQTEWFKSSFDSYVSRTTKLSEMTVKVTQDAFQPVNARLTAAVETLIRPVSS